MINTVIRKELDFDSTNAVIEASIQADLDIIDLAGGTVVGFTDEYDCGINKAIYTIIYSV